MGTEGYSVAVVGATGAVGREMLLMLEDSPLPISSLRVLASARSAGSKLPFKGQEIVVEELTTDSFEGVQLALFSAGGGRSREFAPHAVKAGCVVVDNSSAWRMDPECPLVVPEVNAEHLERHKGIIANPNCSTIQMLLPLKALHDAAGLKRVVVSTYQSASGAGQSGIDELFACTRAALEGKELPAETFSRPIAFDCIPQIGDFTETGYTTEEDKMIYETRKMMDLPELPVSATCVRVPVERGHLESVTVDLEKPLSAEEAKKLCDAFDGLVVMDDPANMVFPVARDCVNKRETFVGRIRKDNTLPNTLHFWVVSDNLWKGAAWNAVQVAEELHRRGLVRV